MPPPPQASWRNVVRRRERRAAKHGSKARTQKERMIVGARHKTSVLVINPCTIANSSGAGYSTLHATRPPTHGRAFGACRASGSADCRSLLYADPPISNGEPRGRL